MFLLKNTLLLGHFMGLHMVTMPNNCRAHHFSLHVTESSLARPPAQIAQDTKSPTMAARHRRRRPALPTAARWAHNEHEQLTPIRPNEWPHS